MLMECMFCHNCFCLYIPYFHSSIVGAGGTEVVLTRVMRKCEAGDPFGVSHQFSYDSKRGCPRTLACARAHADKEDGGPRGEAKEAAGHGIAAAGAVPVGGGRQRPRLLPHNYKPSESREAATTERS